MILPVKPQIRSIHLEICQPCLVIIAEVCLWHRHVGPRFGGVDLWVVVFRGWLYISVGSIIYLLGVIPLICREIFLACPMIVICWFTSNDMLKAMYCDCQGVPCASALKKTLGVKLLGIVSSQWPCSLRLASNHQGNCVMPILGSFISVCAFEGGKPGHHLKNGGKHPREGMRADISICHTNLGCSDMALRCTHADHRQATKVTSSRGV